MLKQIILSALFLLVTNQLIAQNSECDYFGLSKPKLTPKDFNPKLLDLGGSFKYNVEMKTCNEIYFTTITTSENIYVSKKENNKWSQPKLAAFSHPNYNDADPFLTKDGQRIYFISKRPTQASDKNLDFNIWYADRKNNAWTTPKPLPKPINSDDFDEYFFSISNKGNAFFASSRSGGEGSFDIYTTKILGNNTFSEPENLGKPISTKKYEFDPYISPDERFIIFSISENNNSSLYYSYKDKSNNWTTPQNLGREINISNQDFAPSLSPDGKFIFFSNNGRLKWVSSDILKMSN